MTIKIDYTLVHTYTNYTYLSTTFIPTNEITDKITDKTKRFLWKTDVLDGQIVQYGVSKIG